VNEQEVVVTLDQLADLQQKTEAMNHERADKINALLPPIPPEIQAQIDAINAEYNAITIPAAEKCAKMKEQIVDCILALGKSVKGKHLHAVWAKGRVSWDTSKLDGLMIAIPQLKALRSEGSPTVSFRGVKT